MYSAVPLLLPFQPHVFHTFMGFGNRAELHTGGRLWFQHLPAFPEGQEWESYFPILLGWAFLCLHGLFMQTWKFPETPAFFPITYPTHLNLLVKENMC